MIRALPLIRKVDVVIVFRFSLHTITNYQIGRGLQGTSDYFVLMTASWLEYIGTLVQSSSFLTCSEQLLIRSRYRMGYGDSSLIHIIVIKYLLLL